MNRHDRSILYLSAVLLLGAVAAGWSFKHLRYTRQAATIAAMELVESRSLVQQIHTLRDKPTLAGAQEMELTDLTQMIEHTAERAGIDRRQLVRIGPAEARRVADTDYLEKPTSVLLRQVTLEQLFRFLHTLAAGDYGLTASALRLVAPRELDTGANRWTVELTLSYMIYSPQERAISTQQVSWKE